MQTIRFILGLLTILTGIILFLMITYRWINGIQPSNFEVFITLVMIIESNRVFDGKDYPPK